MNRIQQLAELGQSIWYDNIRRALLDSGDMQALLEAGVSGVTSNPSIFEKAIAGSADYDKSIAELAGKGLNEKEIFEALAVEDIQRTADLLQPVYERSGGNDGFVSLEVSPTLANDTEGTVAEARRLHALLDRPNVMIKVPATPAGIPAVKALIGQGISVNVTLMFSLAHYAAAAEAYIRGLEMFAAAGGDVSRVASVASFFISRVDTAVDRALESAGDSELLGRIAIANARAAYTQFRQTFNGERWETLASRGANIQRPLWASTGTKNPLYPDTLYMDSLIGPDTVNTVPPATLEAFLDHGTAALTLKDDDTEADELLSRLAELKIDLEAITEQLQEEGVAAFTGAFESLLASIKDKRGQLLAQWQKRSASLGNHQAVVDQALQEMVENRIVHRIWSHDHTVWNPRPDEISNRLGWLHSVDKMLASRYRLNDFTTRVLRENYTDVLLLGMGGSSLAPEVFSKTFSGGSGNSLHLAVLDSTDPEAVRSQAERLDPAKTLFIVSTKSGGTVETLSFFKYFYNWTQEALGTDQAGSHFIAITDPGSKLQHLARSHGFREIFLNDPNIGGRYSALSWFGLVPAALVGVDIGKLLDRSKSMVCNCAACNCPIDGDNHGAWLGAVLGELARSGKDKLTFITSPQLASFADWVEQLIAESTGKEGTGILPVAGEPVGSPEVYGEDRLFIYLRLEDDTTYDAAVEKIRDAGHPVVQYNLRDLYDLGEQFFLWEMATAVAGYRMGINPFNQPNVEAAKILARQAVSVFKESGQLPEDPAPSSADQLKSFLEPARSGDYIALQAYVQPSPEMDAALLALRIKLRNTSGMATTAGYGPRFLHSTGQLHKGDRGNGLFIQLTSDSGDDLSIPDRAGCPESGMTFGVLKKAQVQGDRQALEEAGRRVFRFDLGQDPVQGVFTLMEFLS